MTQTLASPPEKSRSRPLKRFALGSLALLAIAVLSFPLWSLWLAKPIAAYAGVEIESTTRLGWDRWQLNQLSFQQDSIQFEAQAIELPSPTQLLIEHFSTKPARQTLQVTDWQLAILPPPGSQPESATGPAITPHAAIQRTNQALAQIGRYLQTVKLERGLLSLDGTETLSLPHLQLSPQNLEAELTYLPRQLQAHLAVAFTSGEQWDLTADIPQLQLELASRLRLATEETHLAGTLSSSGNSLQLEASWQDSFIPARARIETTAFALDGRYALWSDAPALKLDAVANWTEQGFDYQIEGYDTDEKPEQAPVLLVGQGSQKQVVIETAKVDLPWLSVVSDKPIRLDFSLENPLEATELQAKLNLKKLPFVEATGNLDATLTTRTSESGEPVIAARFSGADISLWDSSLKSVQASVDLQGGLANIHSLDFISQNGSLLGLEGSFDLQEKRFYPSRLSLDLLNESQRLRDLLPEFTWQSLHGELELEGPLSDPIFKGLLSFPSIAFPQTTPFSLEAQVSGTLSRLQAETQAANESEKLTLALTAQTTSESTQIILDTLSLSTLGDSPLLSLEESARITLNTTEGGIAATGLVLSGPDGRQLVLESLNVSESRFELHASAIDFETNSFNNWLAKPLPDLRILDFDTDATLTENESRITTAGSASWALSENSNVDISWLANSEPKQQGNLTIDHLEIGADSKHILVAEGKFPVSVFWKQRELQSTIQRDAPIAFSLESSPHPDFWTSLEKILPVAIRKPVVKARLSGTLDQPSGTFDLQLAALNWTLPDDPSKSVQLQDIKAQFSADANRLTIRSLQAFSGKNNIQASADLPLGDAPLITSLNNAKNLDFSTLSGKARIELAELQAFQNWLPDVLRQEGSATIDVNFDAGEVSALGHVKNLATRPLPPLGSLSKISGQLSLDNGIWRTEKITGLAEKSPFTLSGTADLNDLAAPLLNLSFVSKEFPLLRDSELLLSGDIDLQLVSEEQRQPIIKGSLNLTKGLFLIEPDLFASSTKTVSTRPPYFAVEQKPFDEWGLEIAIRGDNFLRASNSFFEGVLSAEFDLEGSLASPLLIGKAETTTGRIFFPASSLKLKSGRAFITRDRPSELQIEALAEGRLFAHDINLEVTGPTEKLELLITSNPALTQVEALLLLTTGAIPNTNGNLAQKSATSLGLFIGKGLFRKLSRNSGESSSRISLEVGQDISLQGKQTINARYQLSDDLEIEGEYDKRDEFNANLKWTIFER